MSHRRVIALAFLSLVVVLTGCDRDGSTPTPEATSTPMPVQKPTASHTTPQEAFDAAEECAGKWESEQESGDLDCATRYYQMAIDLTDDENQRSYYQFRLDRIVWSSGQREPRVRERILDFVRVNLDNKEAADFMFQEVLPMPQPANIGERFVIYEDEWNASHLVAAHPDAYVDVSETSLPGNVYEGLKSLQIEWSNKLTDTWGSLIVGFDPHIDDIDRARASEMLSLVLDYASMNEYRLEFAVKADPGVLKSEPFMRVKIQDQNPIVRESLGNQLVCHIRLTDEWAVYSIPLGEFITDLWIIQFYADNSLEIFDRRPSLAFDWSRIKQINFDIPFRAAGSGTILLDDVRLVRADSADTFGELQSVTTTCVCLPEFSLDNPACKVSQSAPP